MFARRVSLRLSSVNWIAGSAAPLLFSFPPSPLLPLITIAGGDIVGFSFRSCGNRLVASSIRRKANLWWSIHQSNRAPNGLPHLALHPSIPLSDTLVVILPTLCDATFFLVLRRLVLLFGRVRPCDSFPHFASKSVSCREPFYAHCITATKLFLPRKLPPASRGLETASFCSFEEFWSWALQHFNELLHSVRVGHFSLLDRRSKNVRKYRQNSSQKIIRWQ